MTWIERDVLSKEQREFLEAYSEKESISQAVGAAGITYEELKNWIDTRDTFCQVLKRYEQTVEENKAFRKRILSEENVNG